MRPQRIADLRARTRGGTVAATTIDAVLAWVCVAATLVAAWTATYLAGGSKSALPHAFYVPVIFAAIRFGARQAFAVAVVAGIVVGPLMPLDVAASTAQLPGNWVSRLVTFVVIGQLSAYLSRHSLPSLTEELAGRRFRRDIDEAITEGHFRLEYQPIITLATGELAGVEALIRWDHPTRGPIPPDAFIGDAERLGCIGQVTRFVIGAACRQAAEWRQSALAGVTDFQVAVNVSALDLDDDSLADHISAILGETGLPHAWLHLEITETALVRDIDGVINQLMQLRMLGIRLAIDDFGTGESSLGHVHRFPVDIVKLDRVFLDRLEDHEQGDVVARAVVGLAIALNLTTVAEGIETAVQARLVEAFGCTQGQGYLFSRPLRPDALHDILLDRDGFRDSNRIKAAQPPPDLRVLDPSPPDETPRR